MTYLHVRRHTDVASAKISTGFPHTRIRSYYEARKDRVPGGRGYDAVNIFFFGRHTVLVL